MVEYLVSSGASLDTVDRYNRTALYWAQVLQSPVLCYTVQLYSERTISRS